MNSQKAPGETGDSSAVSEDMVSKAIGRYSRMCWPSPRRSAPASHPKALRKLVIEVSQLRNPSLRELEHASERYNLTVKFPEAILRGESGVAVLRGLETFCQMVQKDDSGLFVLEAEVQDFPRFAFRGFLLDISCHFLPLDVMRAHVDAMLYNKMNVLHWHIVDSQSFPYVSKVFPKLGLTTAYDANETYTIAEISEFLEFARLRGIRVIPEFDSPGHSESWSKAYPFLSTVCAHGSLGPTTSSRSSSAKSRLSSRTPSFILEATRLTSNAGTPSLK